MRGADLILIAAGLMLAVGLLTVLAWFIYTTYLDRVERRLAKRKGLYRELVSQLANRDRALLEPTIHQMSTLYDLDALEAVLEEQARSATGRPAWLLEVYDRLGLVDKYIDKLRTARKWRDRAFAAELLGRVGGAKAVPALLETVQATQTEDSDVREIALRALARIADPGAVQPLVAALADAEVWLAPRIADILIRHGEAVVDPLIALLAGSARPSARAWAANGLGEVRVQRAFPALERALNDPDDEVRAKSATALGRLGDGRALPRLLRLLVTDPAPIVRARIAATVAQFGGPEVVDHLVRSLGDSAWWVRMRAVEALEQIGPLAEGPLLLAVNDADPEVRGRASVALERLGTTANLVRLVEQDDRGPEASQTLVRLAAAGSRELLAELLQHPSPRIREIVLFALREGTRQDLAAELIQLAANESEPPLRALALETLGDLRTLQALPVALEGLAHEDQRVRIAAVELSGELGGPEVIEALRVHTMDRDPPVRAATASALGRLGGRRIQDDLLRLLSDPSPVVRAAAVQATAESGLRSLVPALLDLLRDEDEPVRLEAARAIGLLGDRSVVPSLLLAFAEASTEVRNAITLAVGRLDPGALTGLMESLLESSDVQSKLQVARILAQLRPPGAVEILPQLVRDPDPGVRAAAIQALGCCVRLAGPPSESVARAISGGLSDPDEVVRAAAVDASSRMCLLDQGGRLLSLLETDPSALVRERAALALGAMRIPRGEETLIAACDRNEPPNVRAAAALAAGVFNRDSLLTLVLDLPDGGAVQQYLRERLKSDAGYRLLSRKLPRARQTEVRAVAARSAEEAELALAGGMQGILDAGERVRLIRGLRSFQGEHSRGALLQIVRSDPSPEVRTAALTSVAEMLDPDELLAFGSRALGDPSIVVRRAAMSLFARVPPTRGFPRLLQTLQLDDDPVVLASAAELAEEHFAAFRDAAEAAPKPNGRTVLMLQLARYIHHPELSGMLPQLSQSSAPEVREALAELLRHRPDLAEAGSLERLAADPVIAVRLRAAGAAAASRRHDILTQMTQDPDAGVRREVALALGRTAPVGPAGLSVLERLAGDSDMSVRAAAYVCRLLQGTPVPLPPDLDPRMAADAMAQAADLPTLRGQARGATREDRRLAAALALALVQDEVAREVARTDPAPEIRHRVSGALELSIANLAGKSS